MKAKLFFNYFAIFILSTVVGSALFFQQKKVVATTEPETIQLSPYIKITLNDTSFLTQLATSPASQQEITSLLQYTTTQSVELVSPIYQALKLNYACVFFKNKKNGIQFTLLKKYPGHSQFQVIAIYQVNKIEENRIVLPYGEIQSMSREHFFFENLQIAHATELEENL